MGLGNVCVPLSLKLISVLQPHSQPPSRCLKPGVEQVVLSRDLGTELHAPAPHAWLQPHPLLVWFSRPDPGRQGDPPSLTYPTLPSLAKQARSREGAGKKRVVYFQLPLLPMPCVSWVRLARGDLGTGDSRALPYPLVSVCCCVPLSCPPWLLGQ